MVKFDSCAFTLEALAQNLLGSAGEAVVDTAAGVGTAGFRTLELDRGLDVKQYALIAQFGYSARTRTGLKGDLYLPFCYQSGRPRGSVLQERTRHEDGVRVQAIERRQFHDEAELPVHGRGFDLGRIDEPQLAEHPLPSRDLDSPAPSTALSIPVRPRKRRIRL